MHGPRYMDAIRRTKILICHTPTDRLHPSVCEGMADGALVMLNRGLSVPEAELDDGVHFVSYDEFDLLPRIRHLLADDDERLAIARRGQDRIRQIGTHARLAGETIKSIARHVPGWHAT